VILFYYCFVVSVVQLPGFVPNFCTKYSAQKSKTLVIK